MALRLVEVDVPESGAEKVEEVLKDQHVEKLPSVSLSGDLMMVRVILEAEEAEAVIERFQDAFGTHDGFRVNLFPLEATIPVHKPREDVEKEKKKETEEKAKEEKKETEEKAKEEKKETEEKAKEEKKEESNNAGGTSPLPEPAPPVELWTPPALNGIENGLPKEAVQTSEDIDKKEKRKRSRISKDELYADLNDAVKVNYTYFALVVLSVVVAAVGLVQNNIAVIIGAMVIAPLLAPNVALSLSTTLADRKLAAKAFISLGTGLILALVLSTILGFFINVDPTLPEIALRTNVGIGDVIVGLAAGGAAAFFFSLGTGTALVGVMVAAALLPPLVVSGLLIGAGDYRLATQSLLLLVSNLIGINLAGTMVFIWEGLWPSSWWEEKKAKRTALIALLIWIALFLVLMIILLAVQNVIVFN